MLPYKLKNNKYIEPMAYKYLEYIDKSNLIFPIYNVYYLYTWDLSIKEVQYFYYESSKFYRIRKLTDNGIITRYYILPFYRQYSFIINDTRIYLKNLQTNEYIFDFSIKRKNLLKDIYKNFNLIYVDKLEFMNYIADWINAVKGQQLLLQI